ncbi:MAG: hypothetical protein GX163_08875 [Bacteroidetes bacterium]|jgi:type I restriction enzyme S subunit|nr:hypothetical protein [Bacteroidota bacterium]
MKNWQRKKIKEVVPDLHQGLNTAGYKIKFYDEGYPIIQTRNLENGVIDLDEKMKFMSKQDWETYKDKYKPKVGDVFLTNIGTIGKTAVVTEEKDYLIHWNIFIFKLDKNILDPFYLKSFLDTPFCFDYYKSFQKGGTVNFITKKMIENLEIPLPPLPEQQRIVAILDETFSAIDKAKANAEQNLKNAKELFESYLQGVFENGSENWKNKTLGELCTFTQGIQRGVKLQSETQANGQVRFLRIVDYTQGNEPPRYIDHPGDKYILNEEDVALVRYGASTGFVCHGMEGALANNLFRVIPKSFEELSNRFLAVYLKSPIFQDVIKSTMNGAAMPAISFGLIKEIPFPLPNLEEQQTIVSQLDALRAETQKLEAVYQKKIADLEELKKSILQKAFKGELRSPEGVASANDGYSPSEKKTKNKISPERA